MHTSAVADGGYIRGSGNKKMHFDYLRVGG